MSITVPACARTEGRASLGRGLPVESASQHEIVVSADLVQAGLRKHLVVY